MTQHHTFDREGIVLRLEVVHVWDVLDIGVDGLRLVLVYLLGLVGKQRSPDICA